VATDGSQHILVMANLTTGPVPVPDGLPTGYVFDADLLQQYSPIRLQSRTLLPPCALFWLEQRQGQ
jgi:hypothetical protein